MSPRRWFDHVVTLPLRRPAATIAAALVVTVFALLAWPSVRFEPDISRVLPADHPHVRIAELLDDRSRPARALWLLLAGDELERDVPELAARLSASPLVAEVAATRAELFAGQRARYRQAPLWQLDAEGLEAVAEHLSAAGIEAAVDELALDLADDPVAARELALRDPLGMRWVLGGRDPLTELGFVPGSELLLLDDGRRALLQVRGARDAFDADFSTELMGFVEAELERAGVQAEIFGGYAIARADQRRIKADFERASTWSVLAIALYLCWVMRGVRLPLLVQLPAMLSILWAIPFGALLFGALPTVAVAAVAVLCGLGVDFAIHYAARYRRARIGLPHAEAVREVQRTTVPELLIDMMTTAVTFLAIGAGTEGGLRAFGLLLALGLVGSVLFTIFALPVLLRWAGDRRDPERSSLAALADRWISRPAAARSAWAGIAVAAVGVAVLFASGIRLSAETESVRPKDDPVTAARAAIERQ
ncbi:MAG: MMPL family transporter, partial [Planctomycetes bacterium]|nr:MMPL family transporter [Planctomycetota bacterium]